MTSFDWQSFLKEWSLAVLASPEVGYFNLPPEAVAAQWLGFPPATEEQIASAEARLGVTLPPSYRAFLKASNGWRHTGNFVERLLPVQEIHRVRDTTFTAITMAVDIWLESMGDVPFDPGEDEVNYQHLNDALVIAAPTDEVELFLLNPRVITPDGEWQAWAFAHWIPGVEPYDSFRQLLEAELSSVIDHNEREARRIDPDDPAEKVVAKLPHLIEELEEKAAFYRTGGKRYALDRGTSDGLQEVADRVRALQTETLDPSTLRERLGALAQEFEDKHRQQFQEQRASFDANELMRPLFEPTDLEELLKKTARLTESISRYSKAEGYRQGAATIRYFLK